MTKSLPALKPDLHPQLNFFICNLTDVSARGDNASMEHPVFSLKPLYTPQYYENDGNWLRVSPSEFGTATVYDRDILLFCISQCVAALNESLDISRTLRFRASDLLIATNRTTCGRSYERLIESFDRLTGTFIKTNIKNGKYTNKKGFHLLEDYDIITKNDNGRMTEVEITLPVWIYRAIQKQHVLQLHPNYFRLRKPIERRIYEIARKHVGDQNTPWPIYLSKLFKKVGGKGSLKTFKHVVKKIIANDVEQNYFPEYGFCFKNPEATDPIVTFYPKNERLEKQKRVSNTKTKEIHLTERMIEKGKKIVPSGTDIYAVKSDWQEFVQKKGINVKNKEAMFVDFCKKWTHNRQKKLPFDIE